jgi:UDP-glucose 4-epimerase
MILVTGGAGFIGSHLVEALCDEYEVAVLDDLSTGRLENLGGVKNKITFHRRSLLDDLNSILRDVDVLFHLAAQVSVRKSVEDPVHDLDVNAKGILHLIESAPDLERVIYASSGGAVYGEPEYLPVDEGHPTDPVSPYGVSKLAGEKYLHCYFLTTGLKVTCLRYANVYGERQDPRGEAGVIAIFLERIKRGEPPVVFGDGEQSRDFVHVEDVVKATLAAMENDGIYNIGTGVGTSVNRLVEIFSQVTGREVKPVYAEPRKGEVRRIYLDVGRAERELGWKPTIGLEEGLRGLCQGLRERKEQSTDS